MARRYGVLTCATACALLIVMRVNGLLWCLWMLSIHIFLLVILVRLLLLSQRGEPIDLRFFVLLDDLWLTAACFIVSLLLPT